MHNSDNKLLHLALSSGDIGEYVFLPGSPERSEKISAYFDNPVEVAYKREFRTFTGELDGTKVSVCSTGMGCPSTAIAVEELHQLGAHTMIRIGTCASTSTKVSIGDIVIPNGAVRMEGVVNHYVPLEFPAVPDMYLVEQLEKAVQKLGYNYNINITITKASFYTQMDAASKPYGYELEPRWKSYLQGGATSTEMESAALFAIGECLRIRTATVLVSATNFEKYTNDAAVNDPKKWESRAIEVGIAAMRQVIREDKERQIKA